MAKRQSRRSISMSGLTYQRLDGYCKRRGRSVAGFVEEKALLDAEGVPVPRAPDPEPVSSEQIATQYFTF